MNDLGFKQLSTENWLNPDNIMQIFGRLAADGTTHNISGEEWLQEILQAKIQNIVPLEIRKLFEVARGMMAYGYYFYPIYAVGIGQLFRVVESAVSLKCEMMGAASDIRTFKKKIDWLTYKGVISQNKSLHWEGIRGLRNLSSHPDMQSLYMPTEAVRVIESVASDINSLFNGA